MGTVAAQVTATATIIKMLGNEFGISYEAGALAATLIFIIYTAASGLFGVVYTDVLQFFMLIIFVYILIPFSSIRYLGGFSSFWQNLDNPTWCLISTAVSWATLSPIWYLPGRSEMWQRAFAAKSKKAATQGMFWGTSIYMVTIALVFFMGLAGRRFCRTWWPPTEALMPWCLPGCKHPASRPYRTGSGWYPVSHDVHCGQLPAGIGPDLCT